MSAAVALFLAGGGYARSPLLAAERSTPHTRCFSNVAPRQHSQRSRAPSAQQSDSEVAELLRAADALMSKLNTENSAAATSSAEDGDSEQQQQQQQRIMKLVCDVNGCVIVPVAADASKVHGPKGSFIGSSGQAVAEANRPRDFLLSEGEGWRLGYDRDPVSSTAFTALVGSDTWSVTMTKHEFTDFIQLLRKLQRSIATLQTCGEWGGHSRAPETVKGSAKHNGSAGRPAPAESSLELQTERIWAQARAPQKQLFDLMKLFQQGLKPGKKPQAAFHLRFIVRAAEGERQREFEGHYPPEVVMRLLEHLETYPPALDSLRSEPQPIEGRSGPAVASYIG